MMARVWILALVLGTASAAGALYAQQHSYTSAEIEDGRKLYEANCGRCHNLDGAGVTGVELFKGQFRRGSTDDDLIKNIRSGIPGTSMPAHTFSETQAGSVVAFLRSMAGAAPSDRSTAAALPGDTARGKTIFETTGNCLSCHAVNGNGGKTGPDLSSIGAPRGARGPTPPNVLAAQLERSILDPNADIAGPYRVYQVTPQSGAAVRGTLLNQDTFSLQVLAPSDKLMSFVKSNLRDYGFQPSPMPSYRDKLSSQELTDLISYLASLKGSR